MTQHNGEARIRMHSVEKQQQDCGGARVEYSKKITHLGFSLIIKVQPVNGKQYGTSACLTESGRSRIFGATRQAAHHHAAAFLAHVDENTWAAVSTCLSNCSTRADCACNVIWMCVVLCNLRGSQTTSLDGGVGLTSPSLRHLIRRHITTKTLFTLEQVGT